MRDASRARSRLALSRAVASALCAFMIAWILFAPGSCSPASVHRVRSETPGDAVLSREGSVAAVVPPSLVNKYAAHPAVCAWRRLRDKPSLAAVGGPLSEDNAAWLRTAELLGFSRYAFGPACTKSVATEAQQA